MPDYVVINNERIRVPPEIRGDGKAIAAWIATLEKAAPAAAKE